MSMTTEIPLLSVVMVQTEEGLKLKTHRCHRWLHRWLRVLCGYWQLTADSAGPPDTDTLVRHSPSAPPQKPTS